MHMAAPVWSHFTYMRIYESENYTHSMYL